MVGWRYVKHVVGGDLYVVGWNICGWVVSWKYSCPVIHSS